MGTVYFRCSEGIPITSPKVNYAGAWEDLKHIIEYVNKKYVTDPETGKKKTSLYAFGCSLGALILGLYAGYDADKASEILDGIVLYATPWNTREGWKSFRENFFGLYSWVIGTKLSMDVRDKILPEMKSMLTQEDYRAYKEGLDTNKKGLVGLDELVYVRMFGYKDVWQYYDYVTVSDQVTKIKVPTFALGASDD